MNPRPRFALFAVVLVAAALAACTGCAQLNRTKAYTAIPQTLVVVCVDRSDATVSIRENQIRNLDSFEKSAAEAANPLDIWVYDKTAVRLWGPNTPIAEDQTAELEVKELQFHKTQPRRGTALPSTLLADIANDPKLAGFPAARIIILTSPDSTFSDIASAKSSLAKLATHPEWRIAVLGVGQKNRMAWQQVVSAFGGRAELITANQADALLRQNRDE